MGEESNCSTINRRRLLSILGGSTISGLAGCESQQQSLESPTDSSTVEQTRTDTGLSEESPTNTDIPEKSPTETGDNWNVDPVESDKIIAAYYYEWYRDNEDWLEECVSTPILGEYSSRDEEVINQHVKWALESGINTFILRWIDTEWEDRTVREHVLEAELWGKINFMTHPSKTAFVADSDYEFGDPIDYDKRKNRARTKEVFQYLDNTLFTHPNHVTVNGRPVMVLFELGVLEGNYGEAFIQAKNAVDTPPYIIADMEQFLTRGGVSDSAFKGIDAVTTYSLHYSDKVSNLKFDEYRTWLERQGAQWRLSAHNREVGFVPTGMPGYNPNGLSGVSDVPILEATPEKFKKLAVDQAKYIDPELNMYFITSWNEWYEDTAVEPRENLGHGFLDVVREDIVGANLSPINIANRYLRLSIDFNTTIRPESADRQLALMVTKLVFQRHGKTLQEYDIGVESKEPYLVEGAFSPENNPSWGTGRWFGGESEQTVLYAPLTAQPTDLVIFAVPIKSNAISAKIYVDDKYISNLSFGERSGVQRYKTTLQPDS